MIVWVMAVPVLILALAIFILDTYFWYRPVYKRKGKGARR